MADDTIFALSSGQGRAGIAVIRVSGSGAQTLYGPMIAGDVPPPRQMLCGRLLDPDANHLLDTGMHCFFRSPNSFTGEDCVELYVHGGHATVRAVLDSLGRMAGFRPADAGEFTRRGLMNGKIDLTQADSIISLIDAETEQQRRAALTSQDLHRLYQDWWRRLKELTAYCAACLDFPDEELPDDLTDRIVTGAGSLRTAIIDHLATVVQGERMRYGVSVVILGPSNAGKSSLLNRLTRSQAAIVSEVPGTTRDSLIHAVDVGGYAVRLIDTAGLQATTDAVEREGIARSKTHAGTADLVLLLFDGSRALPSLDEYLALIRDKAVLVVLNKADLGFFADNSAILADHGLEFLPLSLKTGQGEDGFLAQMTRCLERLAGRGDAVLMPQSRFRHSFEAAAGCLERVGGFVRDGGDLVLIAEELRLAGNQIGRVMGRVDCEDLLEVIFSRFCIGK